MEDKTNYDIHERELITKVYQEYMKNLANYRLIEIFGSAYLKKYKEHLDESIDKCNANLPKSLIDKLGIKKVE